MESSACSRARRASKGRQILAETYAEIRTVLMEICYKIEKEKIYSDDRRR